MDIQSIFDLISFLRKKNIKEVPEVVLDKIYNHFAKIYFCDIGAEKNQFNRSFMNAIANANQSIFLLLQNHQIRFDDKEQKKIIESAKKYISGPIYKLKPEYLMNEISEKIANTIFGRFDRKLIPRIYVPEHNISESKFQVAEMAIAKLIKAFQKATNKANIRIGLSCGSTVLKFVTLLSQNINENKLFRSKLREGNYIVSELTSIDLSRDYVVSTNNCLNFYHALKDYDLIDSESYEPFNYENQQEYDIIYLGIGNTISSKYLTNHLKEYPNQNHEFEFEINEIPFYENGGVWSSLPENHIHMKKLSFIPKLKGAKLLLANGLEKLHAVVKMLRCNKYWIESTKGAEKLCTHLFIDKDMSDRILLRRWPLF
jgi:hypothetical protein